MKKIKHHFDIEASRYDSYVHDIVPYYDMMAESLLSTIPFQNNACFHILDLGCGTGKTSQAVLERFPNVKITAMDISEKMLLIAKQRLIGFKNVDFIQKDFCLWTDIEKYDGVMSSLALHHIESSKIKFKLFRSIHKALKSNGFFINADVVKGSNELWQLAYMEKWKDFMLKSISQAEIDTHWIPRYYATDRPLCVTDELHGLKDSGFIEVDCFWKYFTVAVYGGRKHEFNI